MSKTQAADKAPAADKARPGAVARKHALYRAQLLEAGERVFARHGYEATRMQEVAEEAELALGTVYAAIGSKEALYSAIHASRGRALLERAAESASRAKSPLAALMQGVEAYVAFLAEHPNYLRIHLKESQPWALDPKFSSPEQRAQWQEGLEMTVAVFRAGIEDGSLTLADPELLARLMIASHQVFLAHWVEGGMREPTKVLVSRMQEQVKRSFARPAASA